MLEVGISGRVDATTKRSPNPVRARRCARFDQLDHRAILAHTVESITREKARVGKRGKAFVLGRQRSAEMVSAVRGKVPKVRSDAVDVWLLCRWEWDVSMDGDGQKASNIDSSFSIQASTST